MLGRLVLVLDIVMTIWFAWLVYLYCHILALGVLGSDIVMNFSAIAVAEFLVKNTPFLLTYVVARQLVNNRLRQVRFYLRDYALFFFDWLWAFSCMTFVVLIWQNMFTTTGRDLLFRTTPEAGSAAFSGLYIVLYFAVRWIITGYAPFRKLQEKR